MNAILAQNLLIARTALGWTQHRLAAAAGVSRATIAQLEAGTGDPRMSTLELLAGALHITPSFLLLDEGAFRALIDLRNKRGARAPDAGQTAALREAMGGNPHHGRLEAARIAVDAATEAGLTSASHAVGAAIGAARLPSEGTFLGAQLAHLMDHYQSFNPDDARFADNI